MLSHTPSMGLIIHEFAHYAHDKNVFSEVLKKHVNRGTSHHGSHFEICLRRCHEYAEGRKYWEQVLKNRIYRRIMKKSLTSGFGCEIIPADLEQENSMQTIREVISC